MSLKKIGSKDCVRINEGCHKTVGQKVESEGRVPEGGGSNWWVPEGDGTERVGTFAGSEAGSRVGFVVGFVVGSEFGSVRWGGYCWD